MATREATCHCGQLRLTADGEPFAVSICNCLACQRRTGSAFGMQAGFKANQVSVEGRYSDFARISDQPDRKEQSSTSAQTAAPRSSTPSRRSPTCSSSRSAPSPTRPSRRRPSPATTRGGTRGSGCRSRSHATPPRCGRQHSRSTKPASTPRQPTAGASYSRPIPTTACCFYNTACCREPRRPDDRRARAPHAGSRTVGRRPRHGERGLGLRPDPRRARLPRTDA